MKKIILLFFLLPVLQGSSQNGFTSHGSPSGYTSQQSNLPQGLYLLRITDGDLQAAKRFVKN